MKKFLIIDDKPENIYTLERILKDKLPDIEVLSSLTGEEGVLTAQKELPNLILLDLSMPKMDGYEVCSILKSDSRTSNIPIVIISSVFTDTDSKIKALDIGADAFLAKPIGPSELAAQITAIMRIKKTEDKLRHENVILSSTIKESLSKFDFSLEKYEKVFDNNFSGILETKLDGKIISCNTAFAKMVGYEKVNDLINYNISDFYKNKSERNEIVEILKKEKKVINKTIEGLDKNGGTIYLIISLFLMEDDSILSFITDISSLKRTQKALEEKERIYKDLIDHINDFICTHDLDGIILSANPSAKKLLGVPMSEIIGTNFRDFIVPEYRDQFDDYIQKINAEGKAAGFMLIRNKSGENRLLEYDNTISYENPDSPFVRGFARDVTELKRKTKLLRASEKRYRDLFEKSEDAILIIKNGRFVDCNRATVKMLRYNSKEELLNTHPSELSPEFQPDGQLSHKKADKMINIALEKGSHRFEWNHRKSDGEIFPVEVLLTAIAVNKDETVIHTVWRDITDRKLADKKLKESEQTYRSLFEDSADGMFLMSNLFIDCNPAVCKLFRCKKEDIIGKSPVDFSPEFQPDGRDSISAAKERIKAAMSGIPQRFYWQHKTKDGILFDAEVTLNKVIIENKNMIQASVRDITEQKKAARIQNAIYKISESAYTADDMFTLYENIHKIISTLLPVKNIYIALYNEETEILSFPYFVDEYDPPQADKKLGKGLTEYVLRTGEACLIDEKKDLELRAKGEVEIIGAPTRIWLGVPLKVSGKTIGVIVVQDYDDENVYGEDEKHLLIFVSEQIAQVIERKQNSVQIKKYAEELREANRTKDKFFSIIAHDLKSPFQGLLGFSHFLSEDYKNMSEDEISFSIRSINEISKNAFTLLEDLLSWARLQTGKMEMKPEPFKLAECLASTISLLSQTASNKGIKLISHIDDKFIVEADKNMVCAIIRNLISNAIKFTHKGGEITVTAKEAGDSVEMSVEDNGVGIEKEKIENLFSIDKNLTTKGTANETGTGLGLLLCKEMVEKHGSSIHIESEIGKGSKFSFTIPLSNAGRE